MGQHSSFRQRRGPQAKDESGILFSSFHFHFLVGDQLLKKIENRNDKKIEDSLAFGVTLTTRKY